MTNKSLELEEK